MSTRSKLSERLRALVEADPRTTTELASAAGIDRPNLLAFLAGRKGMTLETLDRLTAALGADLVVKGAKARRSKRDG